MGKDQSAEDREKSPDQGFRVVDRRRFTEEGEQRPGVPEDEAPRRAEQSTPKPEPARTRPAEPDPQPGEAGDVDFNGFIISLATQAAVMLGDIPHPETGAPEMNLEAARQTIDILVLLEQKTQGNLTKEEAKLLDDILSSLRMAYVAKAKKQKIS